MAVYIEFWTYHGIGTEMEQATRSPLRRVYLLDAMALAYRSFFAFIQRPRINSRGLNTSAAYGFTTGLLKLIDEGLEFGAVVFDAPGPTFRNDLYPDYKAHRDPPPEALLSNLPLIKQIVTAMGLQVLEVPGVEADDVIGTLARKAEREGAEAVIVSPDKDFQQLLSPYISLAKPSRRGESFDPITEESFQGAFSLHPSQFVDILALMGDKADNVPGIPGVGEKTALKLIQEYTTIENLVEHANDVRGKRAREGLLEHGDLLEVCRDLVTIRTSVEGVELNWDALRIEPLEASFARLEPILLELEFRSIRERLYKKMGQQPQTLQPDRVDSQVSAPQRPTNYRLITTEHELTLLERSLRRQPVIAFHHVASNKPPIWSDWVGVAISWDTNTSCYIPFPLPDGTPLQDCLRILAPLFTNSNSTKVAHEIKPLVVALALNHVPLRGSLFDTSIAHYLLSAEENHDLGFVASRFLGHTPSPAQIDGDPRALAPAELQPLACESAAHVFALYDLLSEALEKRNATKVAYDIEFPLIYALASMERVGVTLDSDKLREIDTLLVAEISDLESNIYSSAGQLFKIGSTQQLGNILFDQLGLRVVKKTPKGGRSTDEEALSQLATEHTLPGLVIDWRKASKLRNTYIRGLSELTYPMTGRVHTVFHQTRAATGRLSSSDPALQNIPMRSETGREIRRAFVAPPGSVILSADYAQIELRILAHMSGDKGLSHAFLNDIDPHVVTAATIHGIKEVEVSRAQRNAAKAVNYGIPYGLSAWGLAQQLRCPLGEARELMKGYYASFPSIPAYLNTMVEFARENGYAETLLGRRRYLPTIDARNRAVRSAAERLAVNMPIQGTQADIIKLAMVRIHRVLEHEGYGTRMLLQIHDELVFEVPADELDEIRNLVREEMVSAAALNVPVVVDIHSGSTWLDAHQ